MLVELFGKVNRSPIFWVIVIISIILFIRNFTKYLKEGKDVSIALLKSMWISLRIILEAYLGALIVYLFLNIYILAIILVIIVVACCFL